MAGQAFWNPVPPAGGGGGGGAPVLLHVREEHPSGTGSPLTPAGSWLTRTLNAVKTNEIAGASLAANQITLPAGTYELDAYAPVHRVNQHQARLYNVTGAAALVLGTVGFSNSGSSYANNESHIRGRFTLAATSTVRLEHRVAVANASAGGGTPASFGTEVYADVIIRKIE